MMRDWEHEQNTLRLKLISNDTFDPIKIKRVAGVDISFSESNPDDACVCVVIFDFDDPKKKIYEKTQKVTMTEPYKAGFLAFREVGHIKALIDTIPGNFKPDIIMVDGNGILHPNGFGLASHLGVLCKIPTIGVGKTLHHVDGLNIVEVKRDFWSKCISKGDFIKLESNVTGKLLGVALKTADDVINPVFISQGHMISIETCISIVLKYCNYRLPDPIRYADQLSRQIIK